MEMQFFNLYNPNSLFFLATIQIWSRTEKNKTAERLKNILEKRYKKGVTVRVV